MKPIYVTTPDLLTNQLLPEYTLSQNQTGVVSNLIDNIVYEKPSGEYYYYIYFANRIAQLLDIFQVGDRNDTLFVPDDVAADARAGKCKIILDHSLEGFPLCDFNTENFNRYLGDLKDSCVFLTGDYLRSTKNILDTKYINYWELKTFDTWVWQEVKQYVKQKLEKTTPAKYKAICKNRLFREHRIAIVKRIHEYELENDINYSFGIVTQHGPGDELNYVHRDYTTRTINAARIFNYDPQELLAWVTRHGERNLHHEKVNLSINHASTVSQNLLDAHSDSYFEIVAETNYVVDTVFPSEKTFKAIYFMQPFVLCAEQGAIQALREQGYDVFDDIIDHSYDKIKDPDLRLHETFCEIKRLCKLRDEHWLNILTSIKPRLLANFEHLQCAANRLNTDW